MLLLLLLMLLLLLVLMLLLLLLLVLLEQCSCLLELSLLQDDSSCSRRIGRLLTLAVGVCCSSGYRSQMSMVRGHRTIMVPCLFGVVDKVAPGSVWTETDAVERTAQLGLVLWMTLEIAQFLHAVRELALVAVLTLTRFLEWSAQLGFVSRGIDLLRQRFRLRTFQLPVTSTTSSSAVAPAGLGRGHQRCSRSGRRHRSSTATTASPTTATGLHQCSTGRRGHPQQLHQRFHRGCRRSGRRRSHRVRRRAGERIVKQQLPGIGLLLLLLLLLWIVVLLLLLLLLVVLMV